MSPSLVPSILSRSLDRRNGDSDDFVCFFSQFLHALSRDESEFSQDVDPIKRFIALFFYDSHSGKEVSTRPATHCRTIIRANASRGPDELLANRLCRHRFRKRFHKPHTSNPKVERPFLKRLIAHSSLSGFRYPISGLASLSGFAPAFRVSHESFGAQLLHGVRLMVILGAADTLARAGGFKLGDDVFDGRGVALDRVRDRVAAQ